MDYINKILKKVLIENIELKKQIKVLETILCSYIPFIGRKDKDENS